MSLRQTVCKAIVFSRELFRKGWPAYSCKGNALKRNALVGALAGLVLVAGTMAASDRAPATMRQRPLHGTITRIDAPALRLCMQSDTGRQLSLAVANVDALRAVRAGDQVRVDVDANSVVLNITTATLTPRPISYSRG